MVCGIIHNFIRLHDPDDAEADSDDEMEDEEDTGAAAQSQVCPEDLSDGISPEETLRAEARRDNIAKAMWTSYLAEFDRRAVA
jgi:hypothetical protein